MVDEYQDTNRPQYLLIKQLASLHRNLAVVGDPDQSIYKWRGADLRNILDFETRLPRRGHRPPRAQLSLDAGDSRRGVGGRSRNNRNRKDKTLWTDRQGRREDRLLPRRRRARGGRLHHAGGAPGAWPTTSSDTMAVLYRTNAQSRSVEDGLRQANIAYVVLGGVGFYERKEIKDALSYLKLILNPHDDIALRRVINVPPRGIGKGVMDALEQVDRHGRRTDAAAAARRPAAAAARRTRCGRSSITAVDAAAADAAAGRVARRLSRPDRLARRDAGARDEPVSIALGKAARSSPATCATCARSAARRPRGASRT